MEGKGDAASRHFTIPQGDLSMAVLGETVSGKFTYWAPAPNENFKDFSGELRWSRHGDLAVMTGYEDGADYAYRNGARHGPYKEIYGHFPTPSGDLLLVALTVEGDIRVFRNGEDVSGPIEDARTMVAKDSLVEGGGYIFGVAREAGFWLLHNDLVIEGDDVVANFAIPDRSERLGYLRRIEGQIEPVIDGVPVGERFDATGALEFFSDGRHYAMTGKKDRENETAETFFFVDGRLIGPYDGGALVGYHFAGENGPFVYGYVDKGETHVFFGETEIGSFAEGFAASPRTSPDGRKYLIYRLHPEKPFLRTAERTIALRPGDGVVTYEVDNNGDLHATVQREDAFVRLFNEEVIGTFRSVPTEDSSAERDERVFVGVDESGWTLYRGRAPAYMADHFQFARFARIGGQDRLVARLTRGGQDYLVIDDWIAGPFDEVLLQRDSLDAEQGGTFVFHSRTGREVHRHQWRF